VSADPQAVPVLPLLVPVGSARAFGKGWRHCHAAAI